MPKETFNESIDIPTVTFNEEKLKGLIEVFFESASEIIDQLSNEKKVEVMKYDFYRPSITVSYGKKVIEYDSYEDIITEDFEDISSIKMNYNINESKLSIDFEFHPKLLSISNRINLSGKNQTWVLGTKQKLVRYLERCKNKHSYLYGGLRHILRPILGYYSFNVFFRGLYMISEVLGIVFISSTGESSSVDIISYLLVLFYCYVVGMVELGFLLPRLFPKIEYDSEKNMRNQIRKGLGALIGLASALLMLRDLFFFLF